MSKYFLIVEPEPNGHHFEMYLKSILSKFSSLHKIIILTSKRGKKTLFLKKLTKKKNIKVVVFEDINTYNFPIKFIKLLLNQFLNYFYLKRKVNNLKKKNTFQHIFINTIDDYFVPLSLLGAPFDINYSAIFNNPEFSNKNNIFKYLYILVKILLLNLILNQKQLSKIYFNNFLIFKFLKRKIYQKKKIHWFYEPIIFNKNKIILNQKKIILVYGAIKKSKSIEQLINIFKTPEYKKQKNYKVNIIGDQFKDVKTLLNSSFSRGLIKSGKLLIKNKFVSDKEGYNYFKKSHFVWVAYEKKFLNSSGVFFTALKHFKPVITNNYGYLAFLVKKYNLGECVDINNPVSILKVLAKLENNYKDKVTSILKFRKDYKKNSFFQKINFID